MPQLAFLFFFSCSFFFVLFHLRPSTQAPLFML
ncbi:putative signal peptide protein [Puccinia sorghi]|uniref:Putative signal peptide protein n=1 Tax=Puccinia sorghi TaxID=27349 RepID=A0A0L6U8U8_9BASI|nr:putative signal peptide protein [Puccinia sorghi]